MRLLIIQTSPKHTASTFLINALYGLIPELHDKKVIGIWDKNFKKHFKDIIIVKSHNTNIDELICKYNDKYKIVFICSQRPNKKLFINKKYHKYNNVVVFNFNELNATKDNSIQKIINKIYTKVKSVLPVDVKIDKTKCIKRIKHMNERYIEIKSKPFSYIDKFFEIHGSHRSRK